MKLQGKICWDYREVADLINPYAEHMSDSVFRFVHSDIELSITNPKGTNFQSLETQDYKPVSQVEFLKDFLDEKKPHVLAAILGTTGTGKSHLVHWMKFNLPKSEERLVIVVKKSGTSLKQIVKSIIEELPAEQGKSFLDTFNAAGDNTMSENNQRHRILNDLAEAIRETHEKKENTHDAELNALTEVLPDLLQDPHMRKEHFTKDGSVIADIARHIFSASSSEHRPDERRQFDQIDLPDGGLDFDAASALARNALNILLMGDEIKEKAINVLNDHLDSAIARSLNLSGDVIEQLMVELRKYLKQNGKELVLLVEEFARLQGIDRVLLQTITTQGGDDQCKMRTAIAVTDGFFESVAETAYMRTTHIVNMNMVSNTSGRNGEVLSLTLSKFVSRYLNAVRTGRDAIEEWSKNNDFTAKTSTKCDTCGLRETCHAIFGEVDGVGLYPFTERAIWNLSQRVDDKFPQLMNPRIIQQHVLTPVLDEYHKEIEEGNFPSEELVNSKFGGVKYLPVVERSALRELDPQNAKRWIPFLEIYDGHGKVVSLDDDLMLALNIQKIPNAQKQENTGIEEPEFEQEKEAISKGDKVDRDHRLIEKWAQGEPLDEKVANTLRMVIYTTLSESIRWDSLNLVRAHFAAVTGSASFKRTSINFEGQVTATQNAKVQLEIKRTEENATAMQGLLLFNKNDCSWNFDNGLNYFFYFNQSINRWRDVIEKQIHEQRGDGKNWDSVDAAFELLCVQSAMRGFLKSNPKTSDLINQLFEQSVTDRKFLSESINNIYKLLCDNRTMLENEFLAFTVSSKGGVTGNMINPSRFMVNAKKFNRGSWQLQQSNPDETTKIGRLYKSIKDTLPQAIHDEVDLRISWLQKVRDNFGEKNKETIVTEIENFVDAVKESGIGFGTQRSSLNERLENFKSRHFDDAIKSVELLNAHNQGLEVLLKLDGTRSAAVNATDQLIVLLESVKTSVEVAYKAQAQVQNRDVDQIVSLKSKIAADFDALDRLMQSEGLITDE